MGMCMCGGGGGGGGGGRKWQHRDKDGCVAAGMWVCACVEEVGEEGGEEDVGR